MRAANYYCRSILAREITSLQRRVSFTKRSAAFDPLPSVNFGGRAFAMDEQKIQLESKLDYDYIKSNFLAYMKGLKDCNKFSMEELEAV